MQDYDKLTSFLGDWGPFQMAIFFLLSLTAVPNGYVGMSVVFLADTPPHFCRSRTGNGSGSPINHSLISSKLVDGSPALGSCTRLKWTGEGQVNETEECLDGWEFSKERYASTIVTELSQKKRNKTIVCGREPLRKKYSGGAKPCHISNFGRYFPYLLVLWPAWAPSLILSFPSSNYSKLQRNARKRPGFVLAGRFWTL
ncbi:S22A4 protein, partial [Polypterus senegalus]